MSRVSSSWSCGRKAALACCACGECAGQLQAIKDAPAAMCLGKHKTAERTPAPVYLGMQGWGSWGLRFVMPQLKVAACTM